MIDRVPAHPEQWPSLPLEAWSDTCATLHLWTQIVGKVRVAQCPWVNHSWHVTLHVTAKGLTTLPIPYGDRTFQIDFDFIHHLLMVHSSDGRIGHFKLEPQSVATFYARLMEQMNKLDLRVEIHKKPNEVADPIPFDQDESHAAYDREYANRYWRVLVQADRVFTQFRARFIRQMQPRALFLGGPGPRRDAFLGAPRPGASRRHPESTGQGDPGCLFARSLQRWILAGRRSHCLRRVLLLCVSGAARIPGSTRQTRCRVLQRRASRIHSAVR